VKRVRFEQALPCSARALFDYHAEVGAFDRLTPSWEDVEVVQPLVALRDDEVVVLKAKLGPVPLTMCAVHSEVKVPTANTEGGFVDEQQGGPFAHWRHQHRFVPDGADVCRLIDDIEYSLPSLPFASLVAGGYVAARLERMFRYRHDITKHDVRLRGRWGAKRLRIGITGMRGLVGAELARLCRVLGHEVVPFERTTATSTPHAIAWNPDAGTIDVQAASGLDAVVHLAGENIGDGRLDQTKLERIHRDRTQHASGLRTALLRCAQPPKVFVGASAIGYYGDRGDDVLTENAPAGDNAFAHLCSDWEASMTSDAPAIMRTVVLRVGIVLSPRGGALAKVLPLFRAGLGGPIADGNMWMPVIGLDDLADILARAIHEESMKGTYNAVGPEPVTNAQYTHLLSQLLHRPAILPVPAAALRAATGLLADQAVLASARVIPQRLLDEGHVFRHSTARAALAHGLGA
jgi:uncharacterized protein